MCDFWLAAALQVVSDYVEMQKLIARLQQSQGDDSEEDFMERCGSYSLVTLKAPVYFPADNFVCFTFTYSVGLHIFRVM